MSKGAKLAIGLAAALLAAWIHFGPLGNGERTVALLQAKADAVVESSGVSGVTARLGDEPLNRVITLSGPADPFQRRGMGGQKGLTQLVEEIEGVRAVRWADEAPAGFTLPLVGESLIAATLAYLLGLAIGWLFWGRPPREGFA